MKKYTAKELNADTKEEKIVVITKIEEPSYFRHYDAIKRGEDYHSPFVKFTSGTTIHLSLTENEHRQRENEFEEAKVYFDNLRSKNDREIHDHYEKTLDTYFGQSAEEEHKIKNTEAKINALQKRIDGTHQATTPEIDRAFEELKESLLEIAQKYEFKKITAAERSQEALRIAVQTVCILDPNLDRFRFPAKWEDTRVFLNDICPTLKLPTYQTFHDQVKTSRDNIVKPDTSNQHNIWEEIFKKHG